MSLQSNSRTLVLCLLSALLIGACIPQTPIPIYVTPTPQEQIAESPTTIPTVGGLAPSETATAAATQVVPTETPVPSATQPEASVAPGATFMGPIVGPNYTPPPPATLPPRPTEKPTQKPTEAGQPPATPSHTPTAGPSPTALPGLDPSRMGVQLHTDLDQKDWGEVLRLTDQLGLGWAKVQIDWALMQPNGPDDISVDMRRQELYVENLNSKGIKVLVSIAKAPNWARSTQDQSGPPDDPQALVYFINQMLNEFGNVIDAIEIWNEPNLQREWNGRPLSGSEYMRYFKPAYDTINAYSQRMLVDPKAPRAAPIIVVTAGLAPTGTSASSVDDRVYLQQMFDAGLASLPDAVIGSHPFSWGNPPDAHCCNAVDGQGWDDNPHFFFSQTIEAYHDLMTRYGHAGKLWVTEFGWATWDEFPGDPPEAWMNYTDKWQQAAYTLHAFQIGQQMDYIGPMFLWNMNFGWVPGLVENRDERAAYSLLTRLKPQQERPLYWMLYDAVRPDVQLDRYDAG